MEGRLKSGPREGDLAAGYHDIGAISLYVCRFAGNCLRACG